MQRTLSHLQYPTFFPNVLLSDVTTLVGYQIALIFIHTTSYAKIVKSLPYIILYFNNDHYNATQYILLAPL